MGKSIRIKTTPGGGDKYVNVNIEQDFDFLEVLSIKIRQEEIYRQYCSDYGVVVGRVILNDGFGAGGCKVSIFIPLAEEDEDNTLITSLYPFKSPRDQDNKFIRYNLLPDNKQNVYHKPVGTFPNKRRVLNNDVYLDVYDKYYKFTTTTNDAGDFMLFGVPVGNQTVHFDLDLSDMNDRSLTPADLIESGVPPSEFSAALDASNNTIYAFKESTNLDILPQIKSTNISVNVLPFWGDVDQCTVGITRLDWQVLGRIVPSAIFFGNILTDKDRYFFQRQYGPSASRIFGAPTIKNLKLDLSCSIEVYEVKKGYTALKLFRVLNSNDGYFMISLPMNGGNMITNEAGGLEPSLNDDGIPSYGDYRFIFVPNEEIWTSGKDGRIRRARHAMPNNENSNWAINVSNATLTTTGSITNPWDIGITGGYLNQFYDQPFKYFYRMKAGHIYTTNQNASGASTATGGGLFKTSVGAGKNQFPIPYYPTQTSYPSTIFFYDNPNIATGGRIIGTLYFPGGLIFERGNRCDGIPEVLMQGINENTGNCTIPGSWGDTNAKKEYHSMALGPWYYTQGVRGTAAVPWSYTLEVGLVTLKDLNSSYNFFTSTSQGQLPTTLPETSAYLNPPINQTPQLNQDQYLLDGKYYYFYFGYSPGNTVLNLVKERYGI